MNWCVKARTLCNSKTDEVFKKFCFVAQQYVLNNVVLHTISINCDFSLSYGDGWRAGLGLFKSTQPGQLWVQLLDRSVHVWLRQDLKLESMLENPAL